MDKWTLPPGKENKDLEEFNNQIVLYKQKKTSHRPDSLFLELGFLEWASSVIESLASNLESWRELSKQNKDIFMLCSGLGMFKDSSNVLVKSTISKLEALLREDHTSTIFVAYVMCISKYKVRKSAKGVLVPFTRYMLLTILQNIGRILYKMSDYVVPFRMEAFYLEDYTPQTDLRSISQLEKETSQIMGIAPRTSRRALREGTQARFLLDNAFMEE